MIINAGVLAINKWKDRQNVINLTAIRFPVNLLIKQSWRRQSQALTFSLGAEYITQRSTLILYCQINPTSLRVSLPPPCLANSPSIIWQIMQEEEGEGKEWREVIHINRTKGDDFLWERKVITWKGNGGMGKDGGKKKCHQSNNVLEKKKTITTNS